VTVNPIRFNDEDLDHITNELEYRQEVITLISESKSVNDIIEVRWKGFFHMFDQTTDISKFKRLKSLAYLWEGFEPLVLKEFNHLERLELHICPTLYAKGSILQFPSNLRSLRLEIQFLLANGFQDQICDPLAQLRCLSYLTLSGKGSSELLLKASRKFPSSLRNLSLTSWTPDDNFVLNQEILRNISKLKNLHSLQAGGLQVDANLKLNIDLISVECFSLYDSLSFHLVHHLKLLSHYYLKSFKFIVSNYLMTEKDYISMLYGLRRFKNLKQLILIGVIIEELSDDGTLVVEEWVETIRNLRNLQFLYHYIAPEFLDVTVLDLEKWNFFDKIKNHRKLAKQLFDISISKYIKEQDFEVAEGNVSSKEQRG